MAAPEATERVELAKLCVSRNWSKAIRILDSLLTHSCSIQDICNRAFCYSQLELHKHVVKDCDKAIQLDSSLLQPYIMKGHALSALGRKDDAFCAWKQGYEQSACHPADLKLMLELQELLAGAKLEKSNVSDESLDSSTAITTASDTSFEWDKTDASEVVDSSIALITTDDTFSENNNKVSGRCKYDGKPTIASEICGRPNEPNDSKPAIASDLCGGPSEQNDTSNVGKKYIINGSSNVKSISLDFRLSRGIAKVNEGKYDQAVSIFNQILRENPTSPEALIGRGTAYAFQRELDAAIADFSMAIKSNPVAGEAWKRRGQARAALGESVEAIEDLTKALDFEPNSSDILHERGIVNFKFKDYHASVVDLSLCVSLDKDNNSAYTYLGLALLALGEYNKAEKAHLKSIELDQNFLDGWAHLVQFYKDLGNHKKALKWLQEVLLIDGRFAKAYYLRGLLYHGMGHHRDSVKDLSNALNIEPSNIECLYLRASCFHAIGEYGHAVKDYDAVLDLELDSMDKFVLQCLAFYQKEIALYTASKVNSEFCWFDIDGDLDPLFKEYWCKRLHPKNVCEKVFRQIPLRNSLKRGRIRKQDYVASKHKTTLLHAADLMGQKIQYNCPGFLPNKRQYRMAGLAAIEIAQKVSKTWRALQAEWRISNKNTSKNSKRSRKKEKISMSSQNRGGAFVSTSNSSETSPYGHSVDRSSSHISWQDIYSVAVRWRQISEPCDPVVWINKLSEEFNSGFGSHTPLLLGQSKVVRYFPNFERAFNIVKTIMYETRSAINAEDKHIDLSDPGKLQKVMDAGFCSDLYTVVGEDFWVATTCHSSAFDGSHLEGTRITVQKTDKKGFDFAIRTPCTPSRWEDYEAEMTAAWEALCSTYCGETYASTDLDVLGNVVDAALRMTYYWYNFMPLARGSAVVGYVVLLALLLAANMEVTASIPQGFQVDWEAILSSHPDMFINSVKSWLYPSIRINTSWKDYPDVMSTFETTGSVIAALSSYN